MTRAIARLCLAAAAAAALRGADRFVSPRGDDANPGRTAAAPFRTLVRAMQDLGPGDTCWLAPGAYRETVRIARSGRPGAPITFAASEPGEAEFDGCDPVAGPWRRERGDIWRAQAPEPLGLVLYDGQPMTQARWPNCSWAENWLNERKWARTDAGSQLGRIQSAALAAAGIDLTGGRVELKLSKGNSCYSRPILTHRAGSDRFSWDAAGLPGRSWREDAMPERIAKFGLAGNRFYAVAAGALDAPEEWWYDREHGELRFIAPNGGDPGTGRAEVRTRESAFDGERVTDVVFRHLNFRGCNLDLRECRRIRVEACRFAFPAGPAAIPDQAAEKALSRPALHLQGADLFVADCEIAGAPGTGLALEGEAIRVENCVVHDVNWDGGHPGPAIGVFGVAPAGGGPMRPNVITRCTCYRFGGVGLYAYGDGPAQIDHIHLFDGGLYCTDDSALYIPTGERMAGSVVDHNWIHVQHGIGFRVDQWGRGIAFHHNLVWDTLAGCKLEGLSLTAYNNTVLAKDPGTDFPFIVVFDRSASAADLQGWRIQRNVAVAFVDRNALRPSEAMPNRPFRRALSDRLPQIRDNVAIGGGSWTDCFVDPAREDFRPRKGGPLDRGPANVGALDADLPGWTAGAAWLPGRAAAPQSPEAAGRLATTLLPEPMNQYGPAQQ